MEKKIITEELFRFEYEETWSISEFREILEAAELKGGSRIRLYYETEYDTCKSILEIVSDRFETDEEATKREREFVVRKEREREYYVSEYLRLKKMLGII